jgi:hypothetical protein
MDLLQDPAIRHALELLGEVALTTLISLLGYGLHQLNQWIKLQRLNKKFDLAARIAESAFKVVEQTMQGSEAEDKFEEALSQFFTMAKEHNIHVSADQARILIEAAVLDAKKREGELLPPFEQLKAE